MAKKSYDHEYMHNIGANWDKERKGERVLEFFEWRKEDKLTPIHHIPLLLVSSDFLKHVKKSNKPLPKKLLNDIFECTEVAGEKKGDDPVTLSYACVLTDGLEAIVVNQPTKNSAPLKSSLHPSQERSATNHSSYLEVEIFEYEDEEPKEPKSAQALIKSDRPEWFVGLTRTEKELKHNLFKSLNNLLTLTSREEVVYWYTELFWGMENDPTIKTMNNTKLILDMFDTLKEGFDERHLNLGEALAKKDPTLRSEWEKSVKHMNLVKYEKQED